MATVEFEAFRSKTRAQINAQHTCKLLMVNLASICSNSG